MTFAWRPGSQYDVSATWGADSALASDCRAQFGTEKTMTATDVTGFDAIFSTEFFATFSRFSGARLTKLHIRYWRKSKKSSGEPPVETAPRNCRFLSLVVVELVLSNWVVLQQGEDVAFVWQYGSTLFRPTVRRDNVLVSKCDEYPPFRYPPFRCALV